SEAGRTRSASGATVEVRSRAASENRSLMEESMLGTPMKTAVGVSNISVVYLYVSDMERSLAFYRDLLGIPLSGDEHWAEAAFDDGTRFALHATHEGVGPLSSGTVRVSLEVDDPELA